eukprot:523082-Amphidinium_carterae.1
MIATHLFSRAGGIRPTMLKCSLVPKELLALKMASAPTMFMAAGSDSRSYRTQPWTSSERCSKINRLVWPNTKDRGDKQMSELRRLHAT